MTYILKQRQQQQGLSTLTTSSLQRLNKLLYQQNTPNINKLYLKYIQNFYDQPSSYFILIENIQIDTTKDSTKLRIKKIPTNNQSIQQSKQQQSIKNNKQQIQFTIITNKQQPQHFNTSNIVAANFINNQNALILLDNPFELYFITKKSPTPIKIILQHTYQLTNVIGYFSTETNDQQKRKQPYLLIVYGQDKLTQNNKLFTINLMTFDIRQTIQSKQYSPILTSNHFQMFHDDRLYVFGGQNTKNTLNTKNQSIIEELLWSFDLEKGYWFSLQMKYQQIIKNINHYLTAVYDSGKMILLKDGQFYLLEIYQCKITKINLENEERFKQVQQQQKIIGMIVFQKTLYFYTQKKLLAINYSFQKQKKQTNKQLKKDS